jgi:exonuclease III
MHAPCEKESDDSKNSFYEELEQVFYHCAQNSKKILVGDFNAKLEREEMFKPTVGN